MFLSSNPRLAARAAALVIALASLTVAADAEAQAWLADRSRTEGPGIRLGDFELHPGIGVEVGWDSNIYYTSDDPAPGLPPRRDSAILRVTPHLLFSTLGAQRRTEGEGQPAQPDVIFRGGISASYYEFFADERRRNVSLDANLSLTLMANGPLTIAIYDNFSRGIRPFTENTFETSTARDRNLAGVNFTLSTPGNVLQVRAGYRFGLDYFEGRSFQYANNFQHRVELQETFRFFPQTGIVHDTSVEYRDYYEPLRGPTAVFDNTVITTRLGLNGAITPEISLLVMAGYSAGFFDSRIAGYDQDFESVVAQAQLTWRIDPNSRLQLGYNRSFQPSFVGNYFSQDRGYASFQVTLLGSLLLGLEAGVAYVDFGQMVAPDGSPLGSSTERTDVRVDASLFAEYRFTDWLGINGTVSYVGDFTDFRYNVDTGMGAAVLDPAGYNKVELWLGVRVFY
ncbi:MAG: hypothetical protein M3Y87_00130 [Myxococcota bacterium]|nr:hypothetical protein [Myxococcota bacterium]